MMAATQGRIGRIQDVVAEIFGVPVSDIRSRRQNQRAAFPRQVAMYLARRLTPCSLPEIGRMFDRDHTTVKHAIDKLHALQMDDPDLAERLEECRVAIERRGDQAFAGSVDRTIRSTVGVIQEQLLLRARANPEAMLRGLRQLAEGIDA